VPSSPFSCVKCSAGPARVLRARYCGFAEACRQRARSDEHGAILVEHIEPRATGISTERDGPVQPDLHRASSAARNAPVGCIGCHATTAGGASGAPSAHRRRRTKPRARWRACSKRKAAAIRVPSSFKLSAGADAHAVAAATASADNRGRALQRASSASQARPALGGPRDPAPAPESARCRRTIRAD